MIRIKSGQHVRACETIRTTASSPNGTRGGNQYPHHGKANDDMDPAPAIGLSCSSTMMPANELLHVVWAIVGANANNHGASNIILRVSMLNKGKRELKDYSNKLCVQSHGRAPCKARNSNDVGNAFSNMYFGREASAV